MNDITYSEYDYYPTIAINDDFLSVAAKNLADKYFTSLDEIREKYYEFCQLFIDDIDIDDFKLPLAAVIIYREFLNRDKFKLITNFELDEEQDIDAGLERRILRDMKEDSSNSVKNVIFEFSPFEKNKSMSDMDYRIYSVHFARLATRLRKNKKVEADETFVNNLH